MLVISAYLFQYYPLFVMRMFGHLPGLPGFILSAVFSGSLRSEFYSSYKSLITIYQQCINKKCTPYLISCYRNNMKKCINCRQNWRITVVSPALCIVITNIPYSKITHCSTLSSLLSAGATIIMEDGVRLCWRKSELTDKQTTVITKVLAVVMGGLSIAAVLFAMNFGQSIISVSISVSSSCLLENAHRLTNVIKRPTESKMYVMFLIPFTLL